MIIQLLEIKPNGIVSIFAAYQIVLILHNSVIPQSQCWIQKRPGKFPGKVWENLNKQCKNDT